MQTLIDFRRQSGGCGLVELESAYNAAVVGSSEYIKQGKSLTRLVQYMMLWKPNSLQKEDNLIKQKYIWRNWCPKYQESTSVQYWKREDRRTEEETKAWKILLAPWKTMSS